ncbi:hypothetical protein [Treponema socranskii]|nr:hypothetical protein [Treponema socranskii]
MMNKVKSNPVRLYRGGELGKALLKKVPIAAGVLLFAAALVFTGCSNGSDSGGSTPPLPKHAITFGVEGGNGTLKATVGGTEINSGDTVEQGKIVEFTATAGNPATHNVDFWTVSTGAFETGTGGSGSTSAKIKVAQPVTVTVKFKPVGTPPTKYNVTFGVSGTGGTLKAEVDGAEVHSPYQAERNKVIVFTAAPVNEYYAVEKWTDGGTDIAGETNATYNHTVTADADIAVHFKTAPVDVYVTGTSGGKAYVWKNGVPTQLNAHEAAPNAVFPKAICAQGKDVYVAGYETNGAPRPLAWKKDGTLYWISTIRDSDALDIASHNGKLFAVGYTYQNYNNKGASLTDISDPANPVLSFLREMDSSIIIAIARSLCAGTGELYVAGTKRIGSNDTVCLWTKPDVGEVSELELGLEGADASYGVCTAGASVYVAGGHLWKVDGTTFIPITIPGGKKGYKLCASEGTVYAAGQTTDGKAAIWKIEGASASLYATLSTNVGNVYALCAAGGDLYAAGFYQDTDYKRKPMWWHIAAGGTLTEHKLGIDEGETLGICVAPQE